LDVPHFIQVGGAPAFTGAGSTDLACPCGSVLITGYLPANFRAIRIQCFRCGAITSTPGLPEGEILPWSAVPIERRQEPIVTPSTVARGAVLACRTETARCYALTRPRDAPAEPIMLSQAVLESAAREYDRLTGGRLAEHIDASPPGMGQEHGDFPFAWAMLRLRQQIGRPEWSWLQQDDDAMAAMYVAAFQHLLHCWGQHPLLAQLASPLAEPGRFLRTMTGFATAKLLFDAGNRVGFSLQTAGRVDLQLHFSTPAGEPLALAMVAPDTLQWRERDRRGAQIMRSAVADALAEAQGRVNSRKPGIVVLSASILQPDFDQALVDGIHAAFRSVGRKHRGVAAVAVVMPKILPAGLPDRVGFGYAFYPIRNPHFSGANPIMLGSEQDHSRGAHAKDESPPRTPNMLR
jgi:hypothetical protein